MILKNTKLTLPAAALLLIMSCSKKEQQTLQNTNGITTSTDASRELFAKTLAKAVQHEDVRTFIQQEAMKQFDKDYDVLYQLVKTSTVSGNKTFADALQTASGNDNGFTEATGNNPLLTIYVPELPHFSATGWNTRTQIPVVAIRNEADAKSGAKMRAYDSKGNVLWLSYSEKPDFPVLVVKDNERVGIEGSSQVSGTRMGAIGESVKDAGVTPLLTTRNYTLSFLSPSFDGRKNTAARSDDFWYNGWDTRVSKYLTMGINNITQHQRDYIYYNINPAQGVDTGYFDNSHSEYILGIEVENVNSKGYFVDEQRDWTDGFLEMFVHTFFLSGNSSITQYTKGFTCAVNDLIGTNYLGQTVAKQYALPNPIELIPWDMQKFGNTWKLYLEEYDPGTTTKYSTTVSSSFSTNFKANASVDLFGLIKIGAEGGGTQTDTKSSTAEITTTGTSDNLGETIISFGDRPFLRMPADGEDPGFLFKANNTGFFKITVAPLKRY